MNIEVFIEKASRRIIGTLRKSLLYCQSVPIRIDSTISHLLFNLHSDRNVQNSNINPSKEFYRRQFVAHGRYHSEYPNNSLLLFKELLNKGFRIIECDVMFTKDNVPVLCHDDCIIDFAKDKEGHPVDKAISKMTYQELTEYNFAIDDKSFVGITKFEDVISLAKSYNACVEIDLEKLYLGRRKYKLLYEIVNRQNMIPNVIWEVLPHDFYSILLLDNKVILQLNHTWGENAIKKFKKNQKDSSLIILSEWFPGYVQKDFKDIIKLGHQNGFIMKCATLNNQDEAQKMFSLGVNLITTDTLSNEQVIN